MKSTNAWTALTGLLSVCLTCAALTSCVTPTRSLPPSSSDVLKKTSGEVEAAICDGLRPRQMPASLQAAVDRIDPAVPIEALTPEQRAILDAFNDRVASGTRWQEIC